jgi:hypothetical protein
VTTAAGAGAAGARGADTEKFLELPRHASIRLALSLRALAPWLAATVVLAVGLAIIEPFPVGVAHDDGLYVILAKSLATRQGYRWLHLPGAPMATHYPPGYPALLALLWLLFPSFPANVLAFKVANACCAAVAAATFAQFLRVRFDMQPAASAIFAVIALLGIPTLTLSVLVMSEPLFLALLLAVLFFAERAVAAEHLRRRHVLLLGVLAGLSALVRSHGLALVVALPMVLVLRRKQLRHAALCLAAGLAPVVPWMIWVGRHNDELRPFMRGSYGSYTGWIAAAVHTDGIGVLGRTVLRTSAEIGAMFATLGAPSLGMALRVTALLSLGALAAVGCVALWRGAPITTLFLALYTLITLFWPFAPTRFLWAVWPLLLLSPVLGAREILRWAPVAPTRRVLRIAVLVLTAGLATGYATYTVRGYRGRWWASIPRSRAADLRSLVLWAARRSSPTDLLAVEAESAVYLYAGRATVPVHTFTVEQYFKPRTAQEDAAVLRDVLAHYPVRYVAVSSNDMRIAARELATAHPPELVVTDTYPGGLVLTPTPR